MQSFFTVLYPSTPNPPLIIPSHLSLHYDYITMSNSPPPSSTNTNRGIGETRTHLRVTTTLMLTLWPLPRPLPLSMPCSMARSEDVPEFEVMMWVLLGLRWNPRGVARRWNSCKKKRTSWWGTLAPVCPQRPWGGSRPQHHHHRGSC